MSLLHELGYTRVRHFVGGIAEWIERDQAVESGPLKGGESSRPAGMGGSSKATTEPPVVREAFPMPGSVGKTDRPLGNGEGAPAGRASTSGVISIPVGAVAAGRPAGVRRSTGMRAAKAAKLAAIGSVGRVLDQLASMSFNWLLSLWAFGVLGFGVFYWLLAAAGKPTLVEAGVLIHGTGRGLISSVYFSFVTATSLGYGDIVPIGVSRFLAVLEGAAGLLIFGCVISKLVSHRQEVLIEEIHRNAFESRLGRVRTNLHLVLSELQGISAEASERKLTPERIVARLESTAMVFGGELRAVHDLLYRPQQAPEEQAMEALLANLGAGLREFTDLLESLPDARVRSALLNSGLESIGRLAAEICGECVPREYAPELKVWMDRIQQLAHRLGSV